MLIEDLSVNQSVCVVNLVVKKLKSRWAGFIARDGLDLVPKVWEKPQTLASSFHGLFDLNWNDYFVLGFVMLKEISCGHDWTFTCMFGPN